MKKYGYVGTYRYNDEPISSWGYVGYKILWSIPVIGWLFWLHAALASSNRNKKNFARSFFCEVLLCILIAVFAAVIIAAVGGLLSMFGLIDVSEVIDVVVDKTKLIGEGFVDMFESLR